MSEANAAAAKVKLRCAIYTRKSSEEGLDQAFNSLHAQREACEAFIRSQAGEGWSVIKAAYDDGGISGGTLEREGLQRLLCDVQAGRVDVVVVYKVDRLTRALADFAKIVEILDASRASFVSVTQAFNTTTSMGRLTLNVLLSFAQFEREVTGERIRDKIAASKKKGMWMGGVPPLGYDRPTDPQSRALIVNPAEAEIVRDIFQRYLALSSVAKLRADLQARGILSKAWTTRNGKTMGGEPFSPGALFHLLANRVYRGEIVHKDTSYPGQHPAIVSAELFDAVQADLASRRTVRHGRKLTSEVSPLRGLVFDADRVHMSPTFSRGRNLDRRYRYYVSSSLLKGSGQLGRALPRRAPAPALEALVLERLTRLLQPKSEGWVEVRSKLTRVELHSRVVQLTLDLASLFRAGETLKSLRARLHAGDALDLDAGDPARALLTLAAAPIVRGGRAFIISPEGGGLAHGPRRDPTLIKGLRTAHALMARLQALPDSEPQHLVRVQRPASVYERRLVRLAYLAPDIQAAILEGRQPGGIYLDRLLKGEIPLAWSDQRAMFGFAER